MFDKMKPDEIDICPDKKEDIKSDPIVKNYENRKLLENDFIVSDSFKADKEFEKEKKSNKNYSKKFKCEKCEKKYTWYSGLSNHKRFVHNKPKET